MRWTLSGLLLLVSCTPVAPQLPEELVSHNEETVVAAAEHRIDFPPFYADRIKKEKQKLRFHTQMKGKSFVIQSTCEWKTLKKISCALDNEAAHYKLVLGFNRRGEANGHLTGEDVRLEIKTLYEDKDGTVHTEPLGIAITKDGKAIAVLDLTSAAHYWYRERSPTQELGLAAASAALLTLLKQTVLIQDS